MSKKCHHIKLSKDAIPKMSGKEKKEIISSICIKYRNYQNKIQYYEAAEKFTHDKKEKQEMIDFITYIDSVLKLLSPKSYEIIINEFFNPNYENSNWWVKKYSRSTYFKEKVIAINEFIIYVY